MGGGAGGTLCPIVSTKFQKALSWVKRKNIEIFLIGQISNDRVPAVVIGHFNPNPYGLFRATIYGGGFFPALTSSELNTTWHRHRSGSF